MPWSIALNLTFPERVTPHNIHELQALVDAGPHPPPGKTGAIRDACDAAHWLKRSCTLARVAGSLGRLEMEVVLHMVFCVLCRAYACCGSFVPSASPL